MNDQLGGGFHRYSVDEHWFVPHFEKMLYDQAQLAVSYLEAFQITRDGQYAAAARDIFSYVLRDMTRSRRRILFGRGCRQRGRRRASARESAKARSTCGRREEMDGLLAPNDAALFCYRYGVERSGNVEEDPHGEFRGRNILYQAHTIEETAAHFGSPSRRSARRL